MPAAVATHSASEPPHGLLADAQDPRTDTSKLCGDAPDLPTESAELRAQALRCWLIVDASAKARAVRQLADDLAIDPLRCRWPEEAYLPEPGRPVEPKLVPPKEVPHRSLQEAAGRVALLHALAHIEFNAINLALDAIWRFPGMPPAFYRDWLKVAREEALHFELLCDRLMSLQAQYGDCLAHDGLWQMAWATRGDLVARMALVPRTLEARGLDAAPQVRTRLAKVGDLESAGVLDIILRDEVGHVAIGNHWYRWLCARDGLDVHLTYRRFMNEFRAPRLKPPFNYEARKRAGFDQRELDELE